MLTKNLSFALLFITSASYAAGDIKSSLLAMSDQELWDAAMSGKTGKCRIADARTASSFCDYYVETLKYKGQGLPYAGLPGLAGKPYGSGCLVSPGGKNVTTCWGSPNVYPNYNSTSTPICTNDRVKNAANMIRIAINDPADHCDLGSIAPSRKAASRASDLLEGGNVTFGDISSGGSVGDCWSKASSGGVDVGGKTLLPKVKLPSKTCKKLRKMAIQKFGKNYFLPTISIADKESLALGKLTSAQFQNLVTSLYIKVNSTALSEIDKLGLVDVSKLNPTELKAHEAKMAEWGSQLKEPSSAELSEALKVVLNN